ncbi:MAG: hypothetical protein WAW00_01145 [Candidatus Moraniibacteriota bacterium]
MGKTKIRGIVLALSIILFGGSYFAVLAVEENRRLAKNIADREQFMIDVRELDRARQLYLESVLESRAASKQNMELARQQYEELLKNQPSLIQQNKKQATTTVQQLVPVAKSSNVSATQTSKPKSTRTTKTS